MIYQRYLIVINIIRLHRNVDYDKYFEEKLKKVETSVADMEPRIRKSGKNKNSQVWKFHRLINIFNKAQRWQTIKQGLIAWI